MFRRRGDTLLIRPNRVNKFPELFSAFIRPLSRRPIRRTKNALRSSRKAPAGQHVGRVPAAGLLLCDRLRTAFRFQHALRSPVGSGGAATNCTTAPSTSASPDPRPSYLPTATRYGSSSRIQVGERRNATVRMLPTGQLLATARAYLLFPTWRTRPSTRVRA